MLGSVTNSLRGSRNRFVALALLAVVLLLLAAAAWWFLQPHGGQQTQAATYPPITSEIQPVDGAVIRGMDAWITWQPLVPAKGRVLWRSAGESSFQTADATGYPLIARLSALKQGAKYEYIVEDTVQGQTERSALRTFSVEAGLAFDKAVVEQSVNRDYYQPVTLTLHNNTDNKVVVGAKALVHFDDLPADIVGPGSVDEPVEVPPGGSLPLNLAVSAPDARQNTYDIPIEAAGAYAMARVRISGLNFKLSFKVVSEDPHTLARTIDIRNDGDSLADLAVSVASQNQSDVRLQPSVTHGYLPAGQTLEVVAAPVLYLEFQSLSAPLQVSAGGQAASFPLDFKAPAGQQLIGLRTDPDERSVSRDWYCTNKPDTCSNVAGPEGSGPDTQISGTGDSGGTLVAMSTAPGAGSALADLADLADPASSADVLSPAGGPEVLQGSCSSCNTTGACKDVATLQGLIDSYGGGDAGAGHSQRTFGLGSFQNFVQDFDPVLKKLNTGLASCQGSSQAADMHSLLSRIGQDRSDFKSLTSLAQFPTSVSCTYETLGEPPRPGEKEQCADYHSVQDMYAALRQLADTLGCPTQGNSAPKHTICPEMDKLEQIKGRVERAKQVTQILQKIAADKGSKDEELAKGLEQTIQNFETLANILGKIIKAGKYCAEVRDFINEAKDFLAAIDEINSAGCDTKQFARGFDDLFRSAGKLAGHLPLGNDVNWIFQAMASNHHFFEVVGGDLNPEQRWADQFSNIQDYVPNCQK